MRPVRVIGLGQRTAGDDGAGLAVISALQHADLPANVECLTVAEPSALVPLLWTPCRVVIVDAVIAMPAGEVRELDPNQLDTPALGGVSSHGLGVVQAIELAGITEPSHVSPDIRILGITIARPTRYSDSLSPAVAAAVQQAIQKIRDLLQEQEDA